MLWLGLTLRTDSFCSLQCYSVNVFWFGVVQFLLRVNKLPIWECYLEKGVHGLSSATLALLNRISTVTLDGIMFLSTWVIRLKVRISSDLEGMPADSALINSTLPSQDCQAQYGQRWAFLTSNLVPPPEQHDPVANDPIPSLAHPRCRIRRYSYYEMRRSTFSIHVDGVAVKNEQKYAQTVIRWRKLKITHLLNGKYLWFHMEQLLGPQVYVRDMINVLLVL